MTIALEPGYVEPSAGDILRHAAKLIKIWGLAKGDFIDTDGCMCETGAVWVSSGYVEHQLFHWSEDRQTYGIKYIYDLWSNFFNACQALGMVNGGPIHNDLSTTTKKEAIAKLLEAAVYADKHYPCA